jgi:hypothetical protein
MTSEGVRGGSPSRDRAPIAGRPRTLSDRLMRGSAYVAAVFGLVLGACQDASSDILIITFSNGAAAFVDTQCANGGCDGPDRVAVELAFNEGEEPPEDAEIEILQYRVDYKLNLADQGSDEEATAMPFFAAETQTVVTLAQPGLMTIQAAGNRQRDYMVANYGTQQVDAVGTLTVAGFDQRNEIVQVSATFNITFADALGGLELPEDGGFGGGAGL